ncbi:putative hydrogenase nickel incorporation protein HypA [Clostridium polyendosporum]|uniref:Hydrogenase maturation factor HypA n=1 Tax=Clostridium polyendosporum TaxID=69208 RepID=A0A919RXG9_9CLOT|nr:hydrogenase maturation nickel metallochaperone HypA [Clostridium polyendosporum]GIM28087.1 putative hydrogenase nickel incorporation protein HypA [Clostridium polyendosporum]
MHEVSIVQNVIEIASKKAEENNLKKINKISLRVGELSGVMEDSLVFAFNCVSKGTAAEGAEFEIVKVEATAECEKCKITFKVDHFNKLCPECNKFSSNIITGYELLIYTIEGD